MASVLAGKYRLDRVIGSGAFGTVYQAEHLSIGRSVAVKVLKIPPGMESSARDVRARFLREARILGKLEHPHAVQILDFGDHEGHSFLVMELLQGRTLADALRADGAMGDRRVIAVTRQILSALSRAHELGLVHRDLKPANVMLVPDLAGNEQVKLLDFGVAAAFRDDSLADARRLAVTGAGMFVGTPQYAAPEQFMGSATSESDVYAVGLLMWEMATGRPAVGSNVVALCAEAHMGDSKWTLPADAGVSAGLAKVIEQALEKRSEARYTDASRMLAALENVGGGPAVGAPTDIRTPQFDDRPGDMIAGKYRLGESLGAGGFSQVIRATHVEMEREVAIKLLDLEGAVAAAGVSSADLKARFSREAKLSSQLKHANSITVYDFGDDKGRWYIVMELVDGKDLHRAIRQTGRFDPKRAARIARDIARSLSEAHHLGFLHRDLKPGNIMLAEDFAGDEQVKVLDFGIATVLDVGHNDAGIEAMQATRVGTFVGTPQYAAPEQFLGEPLSPATDIYMLGLVLWEMLAGRPAISSDMFGDCLKAHLDPSPWRLPESLGVPPGLAQIVYGALEKPAAKRYLSASELADDLDSWLSGRQNTFSPSPTTQERWEPALDYPGSQLREKSGGKTESAPEPSLTGNSALGGGSGLDRMGGDRLTFDPNLDDDFEPEFLKSDEPEEDEAASMSRGQRGGLSSIPKVKEARIELDMAAVEATTPKPVRRPPPTTGHQRPVQPRGHVYEDAPVRRDPPNWGMIAGVAGLILAGIVGLSSLQGDPEPPPIDVKDLTKVETMHLEEFEKSLREPEKEIENRYSTEGIIRALETAGWSYRRLSDSRTLADVHEQGYRISRGKTSMEIRVMTATSRHAAQTMFDQTNPPVGAVMLDNKLVRIFPPHGKHHPDVSQVARTLREYRDAVLDASGDK